MNPAGASALPRHERVDAEQCREDAADLDHEHDRVADHVARIELDARESTQGALHDRPRRRADELVLADFIVDLQITS